MAKKKAAKKKPKKKTNSDQSNGMEIALPEDKIKYLEGQTKSLELQLAHRVESCALINAEYESIKNSLHETEQKYKEQKDLTAGLTKDMTRQYKGMQDELLNKINSREKMIQELTDTLSSTKVMHESEMEKRDFSLGEKDDQIAKLNKKMENMCTEFASILNGAVEQLKDRIEVQGASYSRKVPIQKLMHSADYNYKSAS